MLANADESLEGSKGMYCHYRGSQLAEFMSTTRQDASAGNASKASRNNAVEITLDHSIAKMALIHRAKNKTSTSRVHPSVPSLVG